MTNSNSKWQVQRDTSHSPFLHIRWLSTSYNLWQFKNISKMESLGVNMHYWLVSDKQHKSTFGAYCEVHDKPNPTTCMMLRTWQANAMGLSGNQQRSYKFLCLNSGKRYQKIIEQTANATINYRQSNQMGKGDRDVQGLTLMNRKKTIYR